MGTQKIIEHAWARLWKTNFTYAHWNHDSWWWFPAMVHVATAPVAANSRGQGLQISLAAVRLQVPSPTSPPIYSWNVHQHDNPNVQTMELPFSVPKTWRSWKGFCVAQFYRKTRILKANPVHHAATKSEEAKAILNSTFGNRNCEWWPCFLKLPWIK